MNIAPLAADHKRRGFSITELAIILMLAGLVVAACVTIVSKASPRIRIMIAQHEMMGVFDHARSDAVGGKKEVAVVFYPVEGVYTVDERRSGAPASFGVVFDSKQAEEIPNAFVFHFHPDGTATPGTLSLFIEDYQRNIHVDGPSGKATIVNQP